MWGWRLGYPLSLKQKKPEDWKGISLLCANVAGCPVVSSQPYRAGARPGVPVAPGLDAHCIRSPLPP